MKTRWQKLVCEDRNRSGFTLIEMLIVIIILGILAMVIIPQITVSTEDAKVSTLKTNLTGIRGTIEVYYAQHNMTYPGTKTDGTNAANLPITFVNQLTQFTNVAGLIKGTKDEVNGYIYGPYIKGGILPVNPFVDDTTKNNQVTVALTADVTTARTVLSGGTGWAYWPAVGVFYANDGLSSNSVAHLTY